MTQLASDLQLVKESISAMDSIKPRRRMVSHQTGEVEDQDWGTLQWEFNHLERLQQMSLTGPRCESVAGGVEWAPEEQLAIKAGLAKRAEVNTWTKLPQMRQRLNNLLGFHLEGSLIPRPHAHLLAPVAGSDLHAITLSKATTLDWLLNCQDRCKECRTACLSDLHRLRRALESARVAERRRDPAVRWKQRQGRRVEVEVWNGSVCVVLRLKMAEMFLAVAEITPRSLEWDAYIKFRQGVAAIRSNSKRARNPNHEPRPREPINAESQRRMGNRVKKELGLLGGYWHQGATGVSWQPPDGSGPVSE